MPHITITSDRFPGIQFAGFPYYAAGGTYEISEEQAIAIQSQYRTFDDVTKDALRLNFNGAAAIAATVAALSIENPPLPPTVEEEELPKVEDITELTEEDIDLISIEVSKLLGRTIAEAEPVLIATGGNPELPRLVRQEYLKEVMLNKEIQKGLKEVAEKMLEQIGGSSAN